MTSKAYILPETASSILFSDSGSSPDADFTCDSVSAGDARESAQHDLGAAARSPLFAWRAYSQIATTVALGETIDIYLKYGDGTHEDNDTGTADADLLVADIAKLNNCHYIGSISVDDTVADTPLSASGEVVIYHRYVQVIFHNATGDDLTSTAAEHGFILTPVPFQGQDT